MIQRERGGLFAFLDRRRVAGLLGVPLPAGAEDLHFLIWRPSGDLAYLEALVRFDASAQDYRSLVAARGLIPFSVSGPGVHLPIDWTPPPEVPAPAWWQPSPETPPDAAAGSLGIYGSLAVKREGGRVYARIVDTGHRHPDAGSTGGPAVSAD